MDQALVPKILRIQKMALEDEAYQELLEEHDVVNARFVEVFPTLTKDQQDIIADYFGLITAMHLRMLELALDDKLWENVSPLQGDSTAGATCLPL